MDSLCSIGRSTKKGKRQQGFIGEKGIGFKSVFLVSQQPHIFSNGYQVRFREEPNSNCGIGYIVPEWVTKKPYLEDIVNIYGSNKELPNTIFILPLKPEKVEAVKTQLSELHPEILLFLSKVKRLYVCKDDRDSIGNDNVSIVSIASETSCVDLSSEGADSRVVQLSVKEKTCDAEETCSYFMWRQVFSVKTENRVSSRLDFDQWTVTLGFPFGNRLRSRGTSSIGVFTFLPTAMVTNFPFVIQADFILASSRESILLDNLWNLGILECVPTTFLNAFQACVKSDSLFSSMAQVFELLPAYASSYPELNKVRDSIKNRLESLKIVPYEMYNGKKYLTEPKQVVRILPSFRLLLSKSVKEGASLDGMHRYQKVLNSLLDLENYAPILDFLGLAYAIPGWYGSCIQLCNLVTQGSTEVYMEVLSFLAENERILSSMYIQHIPLVRYTDQKGNVKLCSIYQTTKEVTVSQWLSNIVQVKPLLACDYACMLYKYVAAEKNVLTILVAHFLYQAHKKKFIEDSKLYDICSKIPIIDCCGHVRKEKHTTLVPAFGSKWFKLFRKNPYLNQQYIDIGDVYAKSGSFLGEFTPEKVVLDFICLYTKAMDLPELTPPNVELEIASSPLSMEQSILPDETGKSMFDLVKHVLNDVSIIEEEFYGDKISTYQDELRFLGVGFGSDDVQKSVTDRFVSLSSTGISKEQAFSLLTLISFLKMKKRIDQGWLQVMKKGKWLKTHQCYNAPERVILLPYKIDSQKASFLKFAFRIVDCGLLMLKCIKLSDTSATGLIERIKGKSWLKTNSGFKSPSETAYPNSVWGSLVRALHIPTIDELYYGDELSQYLSELSTAGVAVDTASITKKIATKFKILSSSSKLGPDMVLSMLKCFKEERQTLFSGCSEVSIFIYKYKDELHMLGAITDFEGGAGLVLEGLKSPIASEFVTTAGTMALLKCLKSVMSKSLDKSLPDNFLENIAKSKFLKTTNGYLVPKECILFDSTWESILNQTDLPSIDVKCYESDISVYKEQLKAIGVKTDSMEKPEKPDEFKSLVWIPTNVGDKGKWIESKLCILDDDNDLFGSHLYSLSHFYDAELLPLFLSAFGVREFPSLDDYFQLWNDWTSSSDHHVSKESVFIPDDLHLKNIFENVSLPLFVWFPTGNFSSSSGVLMMIYQYLGVNILSDSVKVGSIFAEDTGPKNLIPKNGLIEKGLIKIILAFLAGPLLNMQQKKRQQIVTTLLNLSLYKSDQPIKVTYLLTPYPNEIVKAETKKMVFWDRSSKQLIVDESGYENRRSSIEFASCFAQEISEGLLLEGRACAVSSLSRIIHMGFVYEFKEDSVDYLLVRENLKMLNEDNEFLGSAFLATKQYGKRAARVKSEKMSPFTPSCKKSCRRLLP
uniref:Sacsin n=1 Tax=Cannabis sativa TaxID=3483 RepID=A0A803NWD8_CANSA